MLPQPAVSRCSHGRELILSTMNHLEHPRDLELASQTSSEQAIVLPLWTQHVLKTVSKGHAPVTLPALRTANILLLHNTACACEGAVTSLYVVSLHSSPPPSVFSEEPQRTLSPICWLVAFMDSIEAVSLRMCSSIDRSGRQNVDGAANSIKQLNMRPATLFMVDKDF